MTSRHPSLRLLFLLGIASCGLLVADDKAPVGNGGPGIQIQFLEPEAEEAAVEEERELDTELIPDRDYVFSLLRYLYRWHIDAPMLEEDLETIDHVTIGYRELYPETDETDHSRFAEIVVPLARTRVTLKRADYSIEELDLEVTNQDFNVVDVLYDRDFEWDPEDYAIQVYTREEMFDWLHETRNDRLFPGKDLLKLIRAEVRREVQAERPDLVNPDAPQVVFLAPASPVINEVWIYWESGHHLVHFTSDDDLADIDTWNNRLHRVELLDLREDVVVSALEKPGSNAYITKDWAGRVLFNCIVLGAKLILPPIDSDDQTAIVVD
ncbi:MAG: hypothetical protein AAFX93_12925 [Verrucomicrobiota bacterium]